MAAIQVILLPKFKKGWLTTLEGIHLVTHLTLVTLNINFTGSPTKSTNTR